MSGKSPTSDSEMIQKYEEQLKKAEEELSAARKRILELEEKLKNPEKKSPSLNSRNNTIYNIPNKNMDEKNRKAAEVWNKQGPEAAVKHMFTDTETGRQLSYSEMRSLYG
jgi:predicted  nucleic acid-binding Zn-ribbon protein